MTRTLRWGVALLAVLASSCLATAAQAQQLAWGERAPRRASRVPTPPVWGAEIRFGAYRPVLATSGQAAALRKLMFDDPNPGYLAQHPIAFGLEVDWTPLRALGLLGLYGRASYWRGQAPGRLCRVGNDPAGAIVDCDASTIARSFVGSDNQALSLIPVGLGVVYRFDMLRRNLRWPVIISAKLGLDYNVWWATLGDKPARTPSGQLARGGSFGWSGAVQVAYAMASSNEGGQPGAHGSYLFAEYDYVAGRALFRPSVPNAPRLDFSDNAMVVLGIAIDFR